MAYKVHFDELDALYQKIGGNVAVWQDLLTNTAKAAQALAESQNMSGAGAESIRSYLGNVHMMVAQSLMELLSLHASNFLLYKQDYESDVDSSLHAVIHKRELQDIRTDLDRERRSAVSVDAELARALSTVSDIFSVSYRDVSDVEHAHSTCVQSLDRLDEKIEALEARHTAGDFVETGALLQATLAFIEEMLGKGRTYKTSFTPEQLAASDTFRELYAAAVEVEKTLDEKAPALETAMENEEQRVADLTAEYEQRQRDAKRNKLLLAGVCVIGSIAAIAIIVGTGGAATPLVVGAVSGVSGAVMSGGNNLIDQYAASGSMKHVNWASAGKDAVVGGVTGFVTGYAGAGVGQAVTSWAGSTTLGSTLLHSSNAAVRFGTGAVIGSASEITSGVVSRGTGNAVEQLLTTGEIHIDEVKKTALDKNSILLDGFTGGMSGGIEAAKQKPDVKIEPLEDELVDGPYIKDGKPNGRPTLTGDDKLNFEQEVYDAQIAKSPDGKLHDPHTGEIIDWKPGEPRNNVADFGHKSGKEYNDMFQKYKSREITLDELKDFQFNPENYYIETPSANRSHMFEGGK